MKKTTILFLFISIFLSCDSIRVSSDYNKDIDFSNLKTYAFSKQGVDKVKINDIDKKRILKAIDIELYNKGFRKSSIEPDFIINFFTKTNEKVNDKTLVNVGRLAGYAGLITSIVIAPIFLGSLDSAFQYVQEYMGLFSPVILFVFLSAIFIKKSTAKSVLEFLILVAEELGFEWVNPKLLRIGASSLLIDIERQLYHYTSGRYANKEKLAIG